MRSDLKRIMSDLPYEKCPEGFAESVIRRSGIRQQAALQRSPSRTVQVNRSPAVVSALLLASLVIGNMTGLGPSDRNYEQLSFNTLTLSRQLASSIPEAYFQYGRNEEK